MLRVVLRMGVHKIAYVYTIFHSLSLAYTQEAQQFLSYLNSITGIEETLIPDPYFYGGGLHEIFKGGFLKVHSDFIYMNPLSVAMFPLNLQQRITLLGVVATHLKTPTH